MTDLFRNDSGGSSEKRAKVSASSEGARGQILVVFAGGVTALLLLAGLVLDGGIAFLNRRDGQNTADVASLSGTRLIAEHYTDPAVSYSQRDIYNNIQASVRANDCGGTGTPCTWQANFVNLALADVGAVTGGGAGVPSGAVGVQVDIHREPGTFLARIAGIGHWDVDTKAIAIAIEPTTAPPGALLPIALKENTGDPYVPGQVYDLTDGQDIPGGFAYISWTGSGDLAASICTPNNPAFALPTTFPGDRGGSVSGSVQGCIDQWIAKQQMVLIPIYSTLTGSGDSSQYTVVGVAAFVLTARARPAADNLRGYFVEIYPFTSIPGGGGKAPSENSTSFQLSLVQ